MKSATIDGVDASASAEPDRPAAATADPGFEPVKREALSLLARFDGVGCLVRDERLRIVWCNDAYVRMCPGTREDLIGSTIDELLAGPAADERASLLRRVIVTGQPETYYQFGADKRLLCGAFPIDPVSFGHAGVLATVQEAPVGSALELPAGLKVLNTPCLDALDALSPSELRALYHIANGRSTAEIAQRLCRATKTVEKHIESIHRKLGTNSRAGIVRLATERGLQAFSEEEWERIIDGARQVRRSR
jgi:DNA-binding CsgD family transcriptional regulator